MSDYGEPVTDPTLIEKLNGQLGSDTEMTSTFLGNLPKNATQQMLNDPQLLKEIIGMVAGNPEGSIVSNLTKKGIKYINPNEIKKETEAFRQTLSPVETSSENIENLSKRMQFAKQSGETEALIPKEKIYSQEGKSDVYKVKKENLPEGNIEKFSHIIEPGSQYSEDSINALQKELKKYRLGNNPNFEENIKDAFGIDELSPKVSEKIEDILSMPTKRDSKYFENQRVSRYFKDHELGEVHENYANNPILENYDKLQSKMKEQIREYQDRADNKTISGVAEKKLKYLKRDAKNLNADKEAFMKTLPENMQNLENEFRTKWATGPAKYSSAESTIRKLSEGRQSEVSDSDILRTFTKPDKNTKNILKELGSSAGRNVLYSALVKVKPGDAETMADTILELKRTKGFGGIISSDIEAWAKAMKSRAKISGIARKGLASGAGALAGASTFGPMGAIIGGAAPFAKDIAPFIMKHLRK